MLDELRAGRLAKKPDERRLHIGIQSLCKDVFKGRLEAPLKGFEVLFGLLKGRFRV